MEENDKRNCAVAGEGGSNLGLGLAIRAPLVRDFVPASLTARRAIVKAVTAQANIDLSLAGTAVLFAVALFFGHLTLHAAVFGFRRGSGHGRTLARAGQERKFPW
jgi:hypothetical protein